MRKPEIREGMRVKLNSDLTILGGGYRGKVGQIVELRDPYNTGTPFVVVRLSDGEIVADHLRNLTLLG